MLTHRAPCSSGVTTLLRISLAVASTLIATIPSLLSAADATKDWPTFRGPGRTATSPDTGLMQQWPEGGPPLVWQSTGAGRGHASLAIAGDRIYTLGDGSSLADDKDEYLLCFDRQNGKPVWKTKAGPPWTKGAPNWHSSRSTPSVDGGMVYALTAGGDLFACDTATGEERWRKNLKADFDGQKGDSWGYSESVLIDDDLLICTPGGEQNTLVALDKRTGEKRWSTSRPGDSGAGHASIAIATIGETRVYVQDTASGPLGVAATDGRLLWEYAIPRTTAVCPTPIVRGDLVFFSAGYKRGGALLKQVPGEAGAISVEEIYPLKKELANKHGGIVLVGDFLYGDSDDSGIPFCAELMTGEIKWKSRLANGRNSASVAAADGCIYFHSANGVMTLVKASPDGLVELGHFQVPGSGDRPSWAHPVIVDGKLYLRKQDQLSCYDLRAKQAGQ